MALRISCNGDRRCMKYGSNGTIGPMADPVNCEARHRYSVGMRIFSSVHARLFYQESPPGWRRAL